jgi:ATP-binding protein involved in chromosome partitioning
MDADVYGPNIPTMMGVTEAPKLIKRGDGTEAFLPAEAHGVKVMSMGFLVDGDQPMVWRGPMLHSVVNQFCYQVEWGDLDYLIVDMPPGTGDIQLSLAQLVPVTGAVLVTTPQEVSLQDVRKAILMFEKVKVPLLGIVENMSYFQPEGSSEKHFLFGKDGGKILAQKFRSVVLAQIPIVQKVREGGDIGRPIVMGPVTSGAQEPTGVSEVQTQFQGLVTTLLERLKAQEAEGISPQQIVQIGKFS